MLVPISVRILPLYQIFPVYIFQALSAYNKIWLNTSADNRGINSMLLGVTQSGSSVQVTLI